mgnify:CR=1 FL=1
MPVATAEAVLAYAGVPAGTDFAAIADAMGDIVAACEAAPSMPQTSSQLPSIR